MSRLIFCVTLNPIANISSQLHGDAQSAAQRAGVKSVNVSISHNDAQAIAVAVSSF